MIRRILGFAALPVSSFAAKVCDDSPAENSAETRMSFLIWRLRIGLSLFLLFQGSIKGL
jgi:hypothetical protein